LAQGGSRGDVRRQRGRMLAPALACGVPARVPACAPARAPAVGCPLLPLRHPALVQRPVAGRLPEADGCHLPPRGMIRPQGWPLDEGFAGSQLEFWQPCAAPPAIGLMLSPISPPPSVSASHVEPERLAPLRCREDAKKLLFPELELDLLDLSEQIAMHPSFELPRLSGDGVEHRALNTRRFSNVFLSYFGLPVHSKHVLLKFNKGFEQIISDRDGSYVNGNLNIKYQVSNRLNRVSDASPKTEKTGKNKQRWQGGKQGSQVPQGDGWGAEVSGGRSGRCVVEEGQRGVGVRGLVGGVVPGSLGVAEGFQLPCPSVLGHGGRPRVGVAGPASSFRFGFLASSLRPSGKASPHTRTGGGVRGQSAFGFVPASFRSAYDFTGQAARAKPSKGVVQGAAVLVPCAVQGAGASGVEVSEASGENAFEVSEASGEKAVEGSDVSGERAVEVSEASGEKALEGSEASGERAVEGSEASGEKAFEGSDAIGEGAVEVSVASGEVAVEVSEASGERAVGGSGASGEKAVEVSVANGE